MPSYVRKFNTVEELTTFLNGALTAEGAAGSTTAGGTDFSDLTVGAFSDVVPGDKLYISGDTCYTVAAVTDDNNLVLGSPVGESAAADAAWRVYRGGTPFSRFLYFQHAKDGSRFVGLIDEPNF